MLVFVLGGPVNVLTCLRVRKLCLFTEPARQFTKSWKKQRTGSARSTSCAISPTCRARSHLVLHPLEWQHRLRVAEYLVWFRVRRLGFGRDSKHLAACDALTQKTACIRLADAIESASMHREGVAASYSTTRSWRSAASICWGGVVVRFVVRRTSARTWTFLAWTLPETARL